MSEQSVLGSLLFASEAIRGGVLTTDDACSLLSEMWRGVDLAEPDWIRLGAEHGSPKQCAVLAREVSEIIRRNKGDVRAAIEESGGFHWGLIAALTTPPVESQFAVDASRAVLPFVRERRYADFKRVGVGGMGVVYRVRDVELNRTVAFKIARLIVSESDVSPDSPMDVRLPMRGSDDEARFEELKARFLQEAWIASALEHPGIVPVYELGQTAYGIPYYTMRYVEGDTTLATAIGKLGEDVRSRHELVDVFARVCEAVGYAHTHDVIHRDLKPTNVALGESNEVVLIDWGLARLTTSEEQPQRAWKEHIHAFRDEANLATVPGAMGTLGYMAPELMREAPATKKSDVFSLGAMLYQVLTSRRPFEFSTPGEYVSRVFAGPPAPAHDVNPLIDQEISDICLRSLSSDPDERTADANELGRAIREWQAQRVINRDVEHELGVARAALEASETVAGELAVPLADNIALSLGRVESMAPEDDRRVHLATSLASLRMRIKSEIAAAASRRMRRIAALASLGVITALGIGAAFMIQRARNDVEVERSVRGAEATRDASLLLLQGDPGRAKERLVDARSLGVAGMDVQVLFDQATRRLKSHVLRHEKKATSIEFSMDSSRVVTTSNDNMARVFDVASGELLAAFRHKSGVNTSRFHPSGDYVVSATSSGGVYVWDATNGKPVRELSLHNRGGGTRAIYSHDGQWIATAGNAGLVGLWNARSGELTRKFIGGVDRGSEFSLAFHPLDADRILVGSQSEPAAICYRSGQVQRLRDAAPISGLASWSSDGKRILLMDNHSKLIVWDVENASVLSEIPSESAIYERTIGSLSLDGDILFKAALTGPVTMWSAGHGTRLMELEHSAIRATGMHLAFDGRELAVGSKDGVLRTWDLKTGRRAGIYRGHKNQIRVCRVSPDGRWIATTSDDRTARIWPSSIVRPVWEMEGHVGNRFLETDVLPSNAVVVGTAKGVRIVNANDGRIASAMGAWEEEQPVFTVATADGRHVACTHGSDVLLYRDQSSPRKFSGHKAEVSVAAFSWDGVWLASCCADSTVRLWNVADGSYRELLGHKGSVHCARFSPDNRLLLTAGQDGAPRIWNVEDCKLRHALDGHSEAVTECLFMAQGRRAITIDMAGAWREWDVESGQCIRTVLGHTNLISDVLIAPDEKTMFTSSFDSFVKQWDLKTGKELRSFSTGSGMSFAIALDSTNKLIAASDSDHRVTVWSVDTRVMIAQFQHSEFVFNIAFSPDGTRLITDCERGYVRAWDISPAK